MIKKIVTVAGSDSSGGAGLQADLKTFQEYGTFGFSAVTSIVTMDPAENWSHTVTPIAPELVEKQLKTIFAGGKLDAIKTGMLGTVDAIEATRKVIDDFQMDNIVIDPVIACKGTSELLQPENVAAMKRLLLPKATITTPNLVEAGILSELGDLTSIEQMKQAAKKIALLGPQHVVVKGGHRLGLDKAVDVYYDGQQFTILENELIPTDYNHGAGCTFAAAITAGLAKGYSVEKSVTLAKAFVAAAIKQGIKINPYLGHVWHGAYNHAENRMNGKGATYE
ncbi:bifunctional hydroxymethylpyrimidine kinase/phosphomethylpyrimidine kinase [Enterococcus sp. JM4C]|uniref:bifunctional hydroxymethylpyrimidine kinase/phosphomethylpyrimidine kinase n=1 Tax=Candidatus Enterococcus huntleyi TaxID=1857217 RepID=UPI0013799293|nr:bifunctional hydroxymethylpyrimidine kinase/phosphomethylpyrimidine kinase [Enterococcus sp. JM4C]KAF1297671.1 bifunctional hydroxymethylpyrimidine kinase/phosphomethylpyrimidine kinase [Enterococcus sp. JM4C]